MKIQAQTGCASIRKKTEAIAEQRLRVNICSENVVEGYVTPTPPYGYESAS